MDISPKLEKDEENDAKIDGYENNIYHTSEDDSNYSTFADQSTIEITPKVEIFEDVEDVKPELNSEFSQTKSTLVTRDNPGVSFIKQEDEDIKPANVKIETGNDDIKASLQGKFLNRSLSDLIEECKEYLPELTSSKKTKLQVTEKPYNCNVCEKRFSHQSDLKNHMRLHMGDQRYQCDLCGKQCVTKQKLELHKKRHDKLPYNCETCERTFNNKSCFDSHINAHKRKLEKPTSYQCNVCGSTFTIEQSYKNHMRLHIGDERYVCDVCGRQCTTKNNLDRHKATHSVEKPFVCVTCNKTFSCAADLTLHTKVHTGEKPYICEMCGKDFLKACRLKIHRRNHTGEKPYVCHICGESFKDANMLRRHVATHSSQSFTCPQCGKEFQIENDLKRHIKRHATVC